MHQTQPRSLMYQIMHRFITMVKTFTTKHKTIFTVELYNEQSKWHGENTRKRKWLLHEWFFDGLGLSNFKLIQPNQEEMSRNSFQKWKFCNNFFVNVICFPLLKLVHLTFFIWFESLKKLLYILNYTNYL